jgi:E3 ubiquitin-protein ligase HECTD2
MAHLPDDCHHCLVSWFSRYSVGHFERIVDLFGSFVTYRMTRQHGRKRSESAKNDDGLVPSFSSAAGNTPAELHAALNGRAAGKQAKDKRDRPVVYGDDWQVQAAARVMALLFTANTANIPRKHDTGFGLVKYPSGRRGNMVPISSFYNTLLDYSDLVADFETWESRSSKFSFCQYPFFLSIWAKIHVLEYDARRQMEVKAREAFFNSILNHKAVSQYLVLKVRRDCLVEDSMRGVSEVVGSGQEDIKKGLRIEFTGEEGVDAGGLRKEWFLLLVREVFDPEHGKWLFFSCGH